MKKTKKAKCHNDRKLINLWWLLFGKGKGDDGDGDGDGEMLRRNNAKCSVSLKEVIKVESTEHKCVSVSVCVNSTGGWKAESAGREWTGRRRSRRRKEDKPVFFAATIWRLGQRNGLLLTASRTQLNWTELKRADGMFYGKEQTSQWESERAGDQGAAVSAEKREREKVGKAVTV